MTLSDLQRGFLLGFAVAGMLGFILQQLRLAINTMGERNRPQVVVTPTDDTPVEVVGRSFGGCVEFIVWIVVLAAVVWATARFIL